MKYDPDAGAVTVTPTVPDPTGPTAPSAGQPPVTAPATSPDAVTTDPGYDPDWTALLKGDSGFQAAGSAATTAEQSAAAQRKAAIKAAFIQYGGDMPAGFQDAYGDIDQATKDAAAQNPYSTVANLKHGYDQSVEQFRRALAARGMVGSGDMNYGQAQLDRGLGQGEYDAANIFGNGLQGALNGYSGVLNANQQSLVQALSAAETNQYNNPANRPVAPKTATHDAALSRQYGYAVYTDADGNTYDQSGKRINLAPTYNATPPPPMNPDGTSTSVPQTPYVPGATDANGVPMSAGFYGFDANGNWIG